MITLEEFKKRYSSEILEEQLTEEEVIRIYEDAYLEDPMQFSPGMVNRDSI